MPINDFIIILQWWVVLFIVGLSVLPLTSKIFSNFIDKGYIFAKILGTGILSYVVFLAGTIHILQFSQISIIIVLSLIALSNIIFLKKQRKIAEGILSILIFEESIFLFLLFVWAFVRGTNPDIHDLEKFMDFGFINSILRSIYFPPKDMWFTPDSINYYYFGHLMIAVLTKLSAIKSSISFNLSVATIFSLTFVGSFSIGANLLSKTSKNINKIFPLAIIAGFVSGIFVTLAGNLQTAYAFFLPYSGETPLPFWQLIFSPSTFPNSYWYPNATRFIFHTIHEFPIYSFVVSDLHAHVLSLPFVILTIAIMLSIFISRKLNRYLLLLISFVLAILYMTNTWDTITYFLLTALVIFYIEWKNNSIGKSFIELIYIIILTAAFTLPFSLNFKPFAEGIGIICAPQFLINMERIGPFIFEPNHCVQSPIWQLLILYGFFIFWILSFILFIKRETLRKIKEADIFILILISLSIFLIILPEFVYIKDIYTAHYRANTMFKFVYQAFIMLQLASAYIIVRILLKIRELKTIHIEHLLIFVIGLPILFLVLSYPFFAIDSYYGSKNYYSIDGQTYLRTLYPADYYAILWINKNIKGQPIILEAQGDSYTNYNRISANTGLPTVLGWTVHEWLWRGTYQITVPRIGDIKNLYQTSNLALAKNLIKKYSISYVYIGDLEQQKYPGLNAEKFSNLGKIVFQFGNTKIYKIY